ncbi:phage tail domain-containing protein [Staphylococcus succinus]|uniref:phage tail domain-containing protein n=1 Tax=Staphylococcus succinus TaxID=61015 RepID=UPI000937492F|nr:phage tail domain-containing protein [Staphylococcus succinus]
MDLKITKLDGTSYTLGQYDISVKDIVVSPIEVDEESNSIQGLHGKFDAGMTYKERTISVPFVFVSNTLASYPLYRDLISELVFDTEPFYVQEMRRPKAQQYEFKDTVYTDPAGTTDQYGNETLWDSPQTDNELSTGKRYLVRITECEEIEQSGKKGTGKITFTTTELPFAESVGTSIDLERDGLEYVDEAIWSYGMGLNSDPATRQYTFDISKCRTVDVYNFGNVPIDQFNQHLIIRLKFNGTPASAMKFGFNGTQCEINLKNTNIKEGHTITYESGNYYVNGLSILNHTNYGMPVMKTGKNTLTFNKAYSIEAQVECRYYYL